mmetsp:Transcript_116882/g.337762  ORF Transcript_116882/g.337762 Transcript_116882/m.337762 type:complete len:232 (+) Transcript_116882:1485-2180(+)
MRLAQHQSGERHTSFLTTGEVSDLREVRSARQSELPKSSSCLLGRRQVERRCQVLDASLLQWQQLLEVLVILPHSDTLGDGYLAQGWLQVLHHEVQQRRLPRSVRADDGDSRAAIHAHLAIRQEPWLLPVVAEGHFRDMQPKGAIHAMAVEGKLDDVVPRLLHQVVLQIDAELLFDELLCFLLSLALLLQCLELVLLFLILLVESLPLLLMHLLERRIIAAVMHKLLVLQV